MAYQVLARKWRPSNFSEMVGQEHVVKALTTAFALSKVDGRLAEVKLFCEKGSVAFPVTEGIIYTVKKDLGKCSMYVVGDPAASFDIIDGA